MKIPRVGCAVCGRVGGSHKLDCPRRDRSDFILWDRMGGRRVREVEDYYVAIAPNGTPITFASIVVYAPNGDVLRANVPVSMLRIKPRPSTF